MKPQRRKEYREEAQEFPQAGRANVRASRLAGEHDAEAEICIGNGRMPEVAAGGTASRPAEIESASAHDFPLHGV